MQTTSTKNWEIGKHSIVLESIHQSDINISIYERDTSSLTNEINDLLEQQFEFRTSGDIDTMLKDIATVINPSKYKMISQDIENLLSLFKKLTKAKKFRLMLATINSNMCRKFHTDINDLRMLCTYSGPGTLWLTEDNVNKKALETSGDNGSIVIDNSKVQQAKTGAVVILKGAIYPQEEIKAIVHRSPPVEKLGEKRLLLRIDTNEFLNF